MPIDRSITLAIGGLVALAAAMGIGRFVYTPILPVMADALGWTKADAGLVAAANYLGYFLGAIAAAQAWIAARARPSLLTGLAVSAATTTAMAVQAPLVAHLGLRFIGGVASAIVIVCSSSLVLARLAGAGRGSLTSLHFAGVGIGITISAVVVSGLVAAGAGWSALWLGSGAISVIALLIAMALIPAAKAEPARTAAAPSSIPPRPIGPMILAHGLFGFGYVITTTFLVALVRLSDELRPLEPWIWVVVGLAAIPSVAIWVGLAGRIGVVKAYALACFAEAISVALSVEWATVTGLFISAVLLGGTFMGITALGFIAARELGGVRPQQAMGRMTASFGIGQMVGPVFAGWLFERLGDFRVASLLAALALLIGSVLAWLTARLAARPAARS